MVNEIKSNFTEAFHSYNTIWQHNGLALSIAVTMLSIASARQKNILQPDKNHASTFSTDREVKQFLRFQRRELHNNTQDTL